MDKAMSTNLCHGLRAAGIPKRLALHIQNEVTNWYHHNGAQWTVNRIKELKQWYETHLSGSPVPPPWFRKTARNMPTGVWGELFAVKDHAKVLAVLSCHTVFVSRELTPEQRKKFTQALEGDGRGSRSLDAQQKAALGLALRAYARHLRDSADQDALSKWCRKFKVRPVTRPTLEDMTGQSVPTSPGKFLLIRDNSHVEDRRTALLESWRFAPQEVLDFLDAEDRLDLIPENSSFLTYGSAPMRKHRGLPIGRIGLIQEPGLKLRSVANPNRVAQAFTKPLAQAWDSCLRQLPSDCTYDQESGVLWAQDKLRAGIRLAGSDLSSATDLLDLNACLGIAEVFSRYWRILDDEESREHYLNQVDYFVALSRGMWSTPKHSHLGDVQWKQGQPLGLYPSFRLLGLTNNALGIVAAHQSGLKWWDSFRVIGDDIIMDAAMEPAYTALVLSLGGQVNTSKTLISSQVAEFAGRVIEPKRVMRKTYKYLDPSDTSFMSYVSDLGPQAVALLRPRQRSVWENFKFVPGVAFEGPWSKESYGVPLELRVEWALSLQLFGEDQAPDATVVSEEQQLLRLSLEAAQREGTSPSVIRKDLPWEVDEEDLQSSVLRLSNVRESGDPRLASTGGKTMLQVLESEAARKEFSPFEDFVVSKIAHSNTTGYTDDSPKPKDSVDGEVEARKAPTEGDRPSVLAALKRACLGQVTRKGPAEKKRRKSAWER